MPEESSMISQIPLVLCGGWSVESMPSWHEKILLIELGVPLDGELTEMT
jgi:hypothetical protein